MSCHVHGACSATRSSNGSPTPTRRRRSCRTARTGPVRRGPNTNGAVARLPRPCGAALRLASRLRESRAPCPSEADLLGHAPGLGSCRGRRRSSSEAVAPRLPHDDLAVRRSAAQRLQPRHRRAEREPSAEAARAHRLSRARSLISFCPLRSCHVSAPSSANPNSIEGQGRVVLGKHP